MDWSEVQPASAKVLPKDAQGESDPEVLYASVGRALSNWEFLQFSLAFLFTACSGAAFPYPIMRAFGQSMLVTAKLDMIQYAADASLVREKALLERVKNLVSSIRGYNDRRNDIAHGVVQIFAPSAYYLLPTAGTSRKYPVYDGVEFPLPAYCWNATQINRYAKAFQKLDKECSALTVDIKGAIENAALAKFREQMLGSSSDKLSAEEG